jgi:hypothetical protein
MLATLAQQVMEAAASLRRESWALLPKDRVMVGAKALGQLGEEPLRVGGGGSERLEPAA